LTLDRPTDTAVIRDMKLFATHQNTFSANCRDGGLFSARTTSQWSVADRESLKDFPKFTYDELCALSFGVYQVRQAANYIDQHVREHDGSFDVQYCKKAHNVLLVRGIASRHSSSASYVVWIKYTPISSDTNIQVCLNIFFYVCYNLQLAGRFSTPMMLMT
jgi:hypothetical protein